MGMGTCSDGQVSNGASVRPFAPLPKRGLFRSPMARIPRGAEACSLGIAESVSAVGED